MVVSFSSPIVDEYALYQVCMKIIKLQNNFLKKRYFKNLILNKVCGFDDEDILKFL